MLSLIGVGQGEKDYKNEGAINRLKGTYLGMIRCGSSIEEIHDGAGESKECRRKCRDKIAQLPRPFHPVVHGYLKLTVSKIFIFCPINWSSSKVSNQ